MSDDGLPVGETAARLGLTTAEVQANRGDASKQTKENLMSIYKEAGSRDWSKPAVYKISTHGMWWATYRDQHGIYHSEMFHDHRAALQQAVK